MKDLGLIVYITQLGLSLGAPLAGFTLLGVWLKNRYELGAWIIALFCMIGLISGVHGFLLELKNLQKREAKKDQTRPKGFNSHS